MFLQNKYTRWYLTITERASRQNRKKTKSDYFESHHVIPKCMGGTETVLLTAKEHYICHLLLCHMTEGKDRHKMINALIKMAYSKSGGQRRYTARSFELVRKLIAQKNSEMFKGVPKSEKAKQNMKGRSGKWKRLEQHKKRMTGKNNPMYGMKGNLNPANRQDVKEKISLANRGNKHGIGNRSVTGLIWVTNGKERRMVEPNSIPNGFVKGKIMRSQTDAMA